MFFRIIVKIVEYGDIVLDVMSGIDARGVGLISSKAPFISKEPWAKGVDR